MTARRDRSARHLFGRVGGEATLRKRARRSAHGPATELDVIATSESFVARVVDVEIALRLTATVRRSARTVLGSLLAEPCIDWDP